MDRKEKSPLSISWKLICMFNCLIFVTVFGLIIKTKFEQFMDKMVTLKLEKYKAENYNLSSVKLTKQPMFFPKEKENKRMKTFIILMWTANYHRRYWPLRFEESKSFEMCQYSNCYGTFDMDMYNSSDALVFRHTKLRARLPASRPNNQTWIFFMRETPARQPNYKIYNNLFNATWTYRKKSDIWTNYSHPVGGIFRKKAFEIEKQLRKNYAAGKNKTAAWFVSNCNNKVQSKRGEYVKNMQKYMTVDVYGDCGTMNCKKRGKECLKMLHQDYKFYLAFENSICDEYVTEKLWRAINLNIVPVVLGGFNYSELLPHKSYIDIKDYSSPKELADYLNYLDNNDDRYNEYLQWKGRYDIIRHQPMQCSLCEYLNTAQLKRKTYPRLNRFWNKNTDCHDPITFYKNITASSWK